MMGNDFAIGYSLKNIGDTELPVSSVQLVFHSITHYGAQHQELVRFDELLNKPVGRHCRKYFIAYI